MLKPDAEFEKITDISAEFLKQNSIKALILDVDNTLIDLEKNKVKDIKIWSDKIKNANIKMCIATNSKKRKTVRLLAKYLDIPYTYLSLKPLKFGLKRAVKILHIDTQYIAEIGDQIFTDVLGARRMKMFAILTMPIEIEKDPISKLKRKLERKVYNRKYNLNLIEKLNGGKLNVYK